MTTRMVTIHLSPSEATFAKALARLRLSEREADPDFGLVSIDPAKDLYAILVSEEVASRIEGSPEVEGRFANPKIEPYGPPKGRGRTGS